MCVIDKRRSTSWSSCTSYTVYSVYQLPRSTVPIKGCITSITVCGKYESCTGNWYTWSYASCISRTRGRCRRRWAANLLAPRKSWTTFQSLRIAIARRRNESLMRSSHISKYRFVNQYSWRIHDPIQSVELDLKINSKHSRDNGQKFSKIMKLKDGSLDHQGFI